MATGTNVFIGVCVDNCDPMQAGRIRCRIFGVHSPSVKDIPIKDLPWYTVLQSAGQSSVAAGAPAIVTGSWCILLEISTDRTLQDFIVLGTIPGLVGEHRTSAGVDSGFADPFGVFPKWGDRQSNVSFASREDKWKSHPTYVQRSRSRVQHIPMAKRYATPTVHDNLGPFERDNWNEHQPRNKQDSYYPFNEVRESPGGHVFEVDSTPSSQRTTSMHPSGTYEEILVTGERTVKVVSDNYEVVLGHNFMFVNGDLNITVAGDCKQLVKGDYVLEVGGDYYETIVGNKFNKILTSDFKEVYCNSVSNINKTRHTSIHGHDVKLVDKNISVTSNQSIITTAFHNITEDAQLGAITNTACKDISQMSKTGSLYATACNNIVLTAQNGVLQATACDNVMIRSIRENIVGVAYEKNILLETKIESIQIKAKEFVIVKGEKIFLN